MASNTTTEVFGLRLENPLLLASGVVGTTPGGLKSAVGAGAGGVVTKSLGLEAREGHSSPNVVGVDCGYLNAMGLPNPGAEYFADELSGMDVGAPVFASIFAEDPDQFARLTEIVSPVADGIELNLSCPHAEKVGSAIGTDPELVEKIVSRVVSSTDLPVLAKLTPNTDRIVDIGRAAESGGADGVVAINTVAAMTIDIKTRRPILGNVTGGLSGRAIHPIAVKAVYDLYEGLSVPIVGVGGVETPETAIELILAGASALQIGTGVATRELSVFREVDEGLAEFIAEEGLELEEMVGLAHHK